MDELTARLELTPEEMRRLGYRVVDLLVAHHSRVRDLPVTRKATRPELEARLREPLPEEGMDGDDLLELTTREVFGNIIEELLWTLPDSLGRGKRSPASRKICYTTSCAKALSTGEKRLHSTLPTECIGFQPGSVGWVKRSTSGLLFCNSLSGFGLAGSL